MSDASQRVPVDLPQLRTLLLTDLCDSTGLVERLGDVSAAALFREHDRLVLELQQRWRGRLIDRSDGLLLLFERPIDGLGFALDYVRGLRALGEKRSVELQARAGLHVGEVLTWRNSDEAVQVGAKPLEVEGLAKPMAARLMAMARPGQILLSAVAEPLAHRAARELGERGQHLLWKSHGRWRFKGVPDSQQIYEVGEPGIAPLRMPQSTPKAWRDIPLWRRPAALVAEVALIGAIGIGAWFATRPQPAIAFSQRDWVVVADLRNLTGQAVLDDSLEQAFRISLEQSRYVNVLSDMKASDTLSRMQLPPDTVLDRSVASEIALRDGARAVILPTVSEVGGRVRVSAEVIDPHTETTIYAESADGVGAVSALTSIDTVTIAMREKLGEAIQSIKNDSAPLPQVTTSNLDALRAYALAERAIGRGDFIQALQLYERATTLDEKFALAWVGQMRVRYAQVSAPAALIPLRRAQALRGQLAAREGMYLDAWIAEFDAPAEAASRWTELAKLYPDYGPAQSNAAMWLYYDNRFKESTAFAQGAIVPQNNSVSIDYDTLGRSLLGLGEYAEAARSFDQAYALGYQGSLRRRVSVEAARRNYAHAEAIAQKLPANNRHAYLERISLAVDQQQWKRARELSDAALEQIGDDTGVDSRLFQLPVAVVEWGSNDTAAALKRVRAVADRSLSHLVKEYDADQVDDAGVAYGAALLALRMGDRSVATKVLGVMESKTQLIKVPRMAELADVVRAESERLQGRPQEAIDRLQPWLTGQERYQTRVVLQKAYQDAGQAHAAAEQARWLEDHRGLAYIELDCGHCMQAMSVADSNLAHRKASTAVALR